MVHQEQAEECLKCSAADKRAAVGAGYKSHAAKSTACCSSKRQMSIIYPKWCPKGTGKALQCSAP